jgi:hypothetical protein
MRRTFNASSPTSLFRPTSRKARRVRPWSFRPLPIRLEERTLLSTDLWIGAAGDNSWDTAANWVNAADSTDHHVPTASDDAVIDNTYTNVSGVTITVSGSDSVNTLNSQAAIAIGGSLSVASTSTINGSLVLHGTLGGTGDVVVTGATTVAAGSALSGTGALDARGGLAVDTSTGRVTLDERTLINEGAATWSGSGPITMLEGAAIENLVGASFTITGDGGIFSGNPQAGPGGALPRFDNAGALVKAQGAAGAQTTISVSFNNSGSAAVERGGLSLGDINNVGTLFSASSGSFTGAAGTTLALNRQTLSAAASVAGDAVILDGVSDPGSYSAITCTGAYGASLEGAVGSLGSALDVSVLDYSPSSGPTAATVASLSLQGSLSGSGSITVTGATTVAAGSALSGTGALDARGGLAVDTSTGRVTLDERTLINEGAATWQLPLGGSNQIHLRSGAAIDNLSGASFTVSGAGGGAIVADDASAVAFNNQGSFTSSILGGNLNINVVLSNSGSVTLQQGALGLNTATNSGTVTVSAGTTLGIGSYTQSAGSTILNGAAINGGSLGINGGSLVGSGTINVNVTSGGQVIPGGIGAAGTLTINGNYTQTATGALDIDIGGTTAGSQYDQLAVSGTAALGGTLNVATIGTFAPAFGNTFQVLTFGSSSGNFATYIGPSLASGLFLDPVFGPTSLTLDIDRVAISGVPAFPLQGIPIALAGAVTGPSSGHSFTFSWTVTQNGNPFGSGSGTTFTFTPNLNGTYLVSLTVTDVIGGTGTISVPITVIPSIFVLNPTASGALTLSGNAGINIPGLVVVDSSSKTAVSAAGSAQVTAAAIDVVGGVQQIGTATFHPAPTTGIASVADPLGGLSSPSIANLTNYGSVKLDGNSQQTICPGIYTQITVSGNARLTMNSGIYIIEGGGFTVIGNASVTGSGVMIYNAGSNYPGTGGNFGGITLGGTGTFSLSAPTAGPYAGILIFQSRQNTRALSFSGTAMAGMSGVIYAANALLSMSGNASLSNPLDVGMLNLSGNVALTQIAAGSDGTGDGSGIANTLLAGNLSVYINDPSGLFTPDELARIQDAINAWDALLAPYNVTIAEVSDPTQANITIDTGSTSACGSAADGVLGCFNAPNAEITILQGWNWSAGSDPSQIGGNQYDFETTVLHELGHALGLGGSTNSTSPMYETLAADVADRTPTTQDLNIPDPPEGADPQMAAGFNLGPAAMPLAPIGHAAAPGSATVLSPAGVMALPFSSGQWSVVSGQWAVADVQTGVPAGPEPSLVVQGMDEGSRRGLSLTGSHAGLALDLALADLVTDEERLQDGADGGTNEVLPPSDAEDPQTGFGPDGIRTDEARPAPASRPVEIPHVLDNFLGRRLRPVPVSDPVLDELAADAVGLRGLTMVEGGGPSPLRAAGVPNPPVPGDPATEPDRPGEAGGVLARLAVTLFAAGFWGHRGHIRDATNRRAGRAHPARNSRSSRAKGLST